MNKRFLLVLAAVLVLFAFGIASAGQIDGLRSGKSPADGGGPALPAGLESYVNPGGLGDALIYNYFNARNTMTTYFSVVNTDEKSGSRVRIRFYEAADVLLQQECPSENRGSFEVLDFDLCLSEGDMWSGWIEQNPIPGGGARLCSGDDDTLIVSNTGAGPLSVFPSGCVNFKFGAANTVPQITADNTLEGYFVIIAERQATPGSTTCGDIPGTDVNNVLTGNVVMIDDTNSFGYNATAIADFSNNDIGTVIGSRSPELIDGTNGKAGINYILTKSDLISVYDLLDDGATEYVLTAPTKRLSQRCGLSDLFDSDLVVFQAWSDDEQATEGLCDFSPCPPEEDNHLPYEVNIIDLKRTGDVTTPVLLDSTVDQRIDPTFDFGWFHIDLDTAGHGTTLAGVRTKGWPILGLNFSASEDNGYSVAVPMQYRTRIVKIR